MCIGKDLIDASELASWRALLSAHAAAVREIERALAAAELPPLAWYDALWPLYRAPERRLRMSELADEVALGRTGLTRLVDRIEQEGLLRREPVPGDRRGTYAVITPAGAELLRRMWPVYAAGIREHFSAHLGDERAALRTALERVAAAARRPSRA